MDTIRDRTDAVLNVATPRQIFCREISKVLTDSYNYDKNTANVMADSLLEAYNILHRNKKLLAAALTMIDTDNIDIPAFFDTYKELIRGKRSNKKDVEYMYALYREYKFVSKYYAAT